MNCKQGDVTVMVRSDWPQNVGRLFQVIDKYRCREGEWRCEGLQSFDSNHGLRPAGSTCWADDRDLRPLRDSDGVDETITWAGKPNETPTQIIKEVA